MLKYDGDDKHPLRAPPPACLLPAAPEASQTCSREHAFCLVLTTSPARFCPKSTHGTPPQQEAIQIRRHVSPWGTSESRVWQGLAGTRLLGSCSRNAWLVRAHLEAQARVEARGVLCTQGHSSAHNFLKGNPLQSYYRRVPYLGREGRALLTFYSTVRALRHVHTHPSAICFMLTDPPVFIDGALDRGWQTCLVFYFFCCGDEQDKGNIKHADFATLNCAVRWHLGHSQCATINPHPFPELSHHPRRKPHTREAVSPCTSVPQALATTDLLPVTKMCQFWKASVFINKVLL